MAKTPIRITQEKRFEIMEAFFRIKDRNIQRVAEVAGTNYQEANRVVGKYFKDGGIIIKSKL